MHAAPVHDPYAALRIPNYRDYLAGSFLSSIGRQAMSVAIGWEIYQWTHSATALGLVGITRCQTWRRSAGRMRCCAESPSCSNSTPTPRRFVSTSRRCPAFPPDFRAGMRAHPRVARALKYRATAAAQMKTGQRHHLECERV